MDIDHIVLPRMLWDEITAHCRRKLAGNFLQGESRVQRAYGILAGVQEGRQLRVMLVLPVKKNARNDEPLKSYMDAVMTEHAVQSTTPLSKRGWITDPAELMECYARCDHEDLQIFGTYHMHIVPWEGDPVRDTPTRLDTVLAKESNLFSFIISMVDSDKPTMKAFFEGIIGQETPIIIQE
jgi:proteasome lid subunit RPN8/RPN11